jgi:GT2 family glycosyltransferase
MKSGGWKQCDIMIICQDRFNFLRDCVESVIRHTSYPYNIFLIYDARDGNTQRRIKHHVKNYPHITLYPIENRHRYHAACNIGLRASAGAYIVLLNSDTYVLPGWLENMVQCAESKKNIALVNPVMNSSFFDCFPIPPGLDIYTLSEKIQELSRKTYPDVFGASGSCLLIKKEALKDLGLFDEGYRHEYWQDLDYSMRALSKGWRIVLADNTFVYHNGLETVSIASRERMYAADHTLFFQKWERIYRKQSAKFLKQEPLQYLRKAIFPQPERLLYRIFFDSLPMTLYRDGIEFFRTASLTDIFAHRTSIVHHIKRRLDKKKSHHNKGKNIDVFTTATVGSKYVNNLPRRRGLSIIFLVTHLNIAGGVISIIQLVNEFIKRGHTAQVVTLNPAPNNDLLQLYTRPLIYRNIHAMAKNFPKCDILVATFWRTAYLWYKKIVRDHPHVLPFYFIQDYESWFYPEGDSRQKKVFESYSYIPNRIVKSAWLEGILKKHGFSSHKIHLGLNLDIFYPRMMNNAQPPYRILSFAAPDTPRRGFEHAVKAFQELCSRRRDVHIVFFGAKDLSCYNLCFPHENYGVIWDQNKVAEIYSSCHVAVDTSLFQGFGRLGLEAMACGTPAVLPKTGGITEYAKDGINCLMVNSKNPQAVAGAIESILDNSSLRKKLISEGKKTARKFCHKDEAEKILNLFLEQFEQHKKGLSSSDRSP